MSRQSFPVRSLRNLVMQDDKQAVQTNFIRKIIESDLDNNPDFPRIMTRFPGAKRVFTYRPCKINLFEFRFSR